MDTTFSRPAMSTLTNRVHLVSALSKEKITKDVDTAMGDALPSNGHIEPGVSVRNGPMEEMDVDMNGTSNGKRKSRGSLGKTVSYAEADSSGEDDKPLVRSTLERRMFGLDD